MDKINKFNFNIYVDADACPTKTETIMIATRHKINVYIVSNGGIRPITNTLVKTVVVDSGPDMADKWIIENVHRNDIVITSDLPLGSLCIRKGAFVISHNGEIINIQNIGLKIASRDLMSDVRSADPFYRAKGKAYSKSDKVRFINALEKVVQTIKKSL